MLASHWGLLCTCFLKDVAPHQCPEALYPFPSSLQFPSSQMSVSGRHRQPVMRNWSQLEETLVFQSKMEFQLIQVQSTQTEMYIINMEWWVFQLIQNMVDARNLSPGSWGKWPNKQEICFSSTLFAASQEPRSPLRYNHSYSQTWYLHFKRKGCSLCSPPTNQKLVIDGVHKGASWRIQGRSSIFCHLCWHFFSDSSSFLVNWIEPIQMCP